MQSSTKATARPPGYKDKQYDKRYGNIKEYRKRCAIAHSNTHQLCCCCMVKPSEQIHHAFYLKKGNRAGFNEFPVCQRCHEEICHHPKNWVVNFKAPTYGNRNTPEFTERLRLGYQLLNSGITF